MKRVRFAGALGAELSGWFHPAAEPSRGALVLAHCFTCGKDLPLYRRLAAGLADEGLSVLRFDFTGLGQSEGDFSQTSLDSNVAEVQLACRELRRLVGVSVRLGAIGHSLGGVATLLAAGELPELAALAILAAPADPGALEARLGPGVRQQAEERGAARVELGGRPVRIGLPLLDSLAVRDLPGRLGGLGRPVLFMHGTVDEVVSIEQSELLFAACRQPKGFEPLLGGDHLFSEERTLGFAQTLLRCWFERHLAV